MNDQTSPTGPALAKSLGGTFDVDSAVVRFRNRNYFVRCSTTGRVHLVVQDGRSVPLGRISEGIAVLGREFIDALAVEHLARPGATISELARLLDHYDPTPGLVARGVMADPDEDADDHSGARDVEF